MKGHPPRKLRIRLMTLAMLWIGLTGLVLGAERLPLANLFPEFLATAPRLRRAVLSTPWPDWQRRLELTDEPAARAVLRRLGKAWARARRRPEPSPVRGPWARWVVELDFGPQGRRELWVLPDGRLWEPAAGKTQPAASKTHPAAREAQPPAGEVLESPALQAAVAQLAWQFSERVFGEALPWPEAGRLFPDGSQFVLEDVRTGRWLKVQRYGGYRHVDVEPVDRSDTAVLRELFGGQWSWRRRPVVAMVGERRIAASINGMPHGGGSIAGNDFPGHFCLHFSGSWLHLRGRPDTSHQLMVRQAAGQLAQTLEAATPEELVRWVLAAVQEGDEATLMYASEGYDRPLARRLMATVYHMTVLAVRRTAAPPGGAGTPGADAGASGATVRRGAGNPPEGFIDNGSPYGFPSLNGPKLVVEADLLVYRHPHPNAGYPVTLRLNLRPRFAAGPWRGWVVALPELAQLLQQPAGARPLLLSGGYPGC